VRANYADASSQEAIELAVMDCSMHNLKAFTVGDGLARNSKNVYYTCTMKHTSFWNTLAQPIIALSPMDGVTDALFSSIVASR